MKPLNEFFKIDKAKLLYDLFPQHIPDMLQYIKGMSDTIEEDHTRIRESWKPDSIVTFDTWLSWAVDAGMTINRYGDKLHKNKRLFCDQLFVGYIAIFTCHCISSYTKTRKHQDPKFTLAVDLLFNPQLQIP